MTPPVRLDQLLADVEVLHLRGDPASVEVVGITAASDSVRPGSLFCCVRGRVVDGHDFAAAAVAAGAVAVLGERELSDLPREVPQVIVADSRAALARAAAALHRHPSRRVAVIGVTGTNGKTTTTHLLKAVLEADGRPTEVIGTLSGPRTTPEATELQAALAAAADRGVAAVALEVSSHALALHRVDAIWFSVAVFTNLSPEHLDFHDGMDDYFSVKAQLFSPERARVAVVNADDPWGRRLLAAARLPTRTFSLADAAGLELGPDGARFRWDGHPVWLRPGGTFNVANALAAAAAARELDVPSDAVAAGLSAARVVPGRFESVDRGQPYRVLVDFAHTPAALEACLLAAREMAGEGRVTVVFGCGGDRDQAKRRLMGAVASRRADRIVLTSDNPRSEDPRAIIDEVLAGVDRVGGGPGVVVVEPDRRAAIGLALESARPGDVVVVAGKGHETSQITGDDAVPFDDRIVAGEALDRLAAASGSGVGAGG
jgi:UDP-N-acetylmuramoyl-L-alanyl-D-glutamate--2,6-diaminopimelate ligase